jgi:hypothetical protein
LRNCGQTRIQPRNLLKASSTVGQPVVRLGKLCQWICVAALLAGAIATARASDPNGIYAFVDRVVFEPDDAKPERIQVCGGFALANPTNRDDSTPPNAATCISSCGPATRTCVERNGPTSSR